MLKRERVGGKKEKEILLHKEQVWSLQRGWRRTCSVASAGRRWLPLYHNSGRSLDKKKSKPRNKTPEEGKYPGTKRISLKKSWKARRRSLYFSSWYRTAYERGECEGTAMTRQKLNVTKGFAADQMPHRCGFVVTLMSFQRHQTEVPIVRDKLSGNHSLDPTYSSLTGT